MECTIIAIAGFAGFILFVVPGTFYVYERWHRMPYRWCVQKTLMLIGGLIICFALAWPALRIMSAVMCHL